MPDSLASLVQQRPPGKLEDLGVPAALVEDLFMRRLMIERMSTVHDISVALGIRMSIGQEISEELRDKHLLEYHGMEGRDYRVGLTEHGTRVAMERMQTSTYADIVPVSLESYISTIESQKAELQINRESIRSAFSDLVVEDTMLDQLGPAFLNDGAIFLYGPPGTGKTSLAERMIRIHKDQVLIPHAICVDGAIITVFDPSIHHAAPEQPVDLDPRWVACSRPLVVVGGEMSLESVELEYDANNGIYAAPIQMQANNGILVVDDFGRQTFKPDQLLNRWIMPLSRGVDFLKIGSGAKFTVPFELKLVASTNLDPNALGDDAFLRRLRNKVFVGPISENAFNWILVRVAKARGIEVTADDASYLRSIAQREIGELRPYLVPDFCELMEGICLYENVPKKLDKAMIDRVADVYFVTDAKGAATVSRKNAPRATVNGVGSTPAPGPAPAPTPTPTPTQSPMPAPVAAPAPALAGQMATPTPQQAPAGFQRPI